jgi:hypothetical protein
MMQKLFIIFSLIVLVISLVSSAFRPMAGWSLLVILPAFMLSIYDILQNH